MTSYLQSAQDFLYRRRRPLLFVGGLAGGVYVAANYAVSKLSEMQRRMVEERRDRENIRRRFQQNQEDCTYTILALLPTLGDQLFAYTDVEGLTAKLQKGRITGSTAARNTAKDGDRADDATLVPQKNGIAMHGPESDQTAQVSLPAEMQINDPTKAMEEAWSKVGVNGSVESSHEGVVNGSQNVSQEHVQTNILAGQDAHANDVKASEEAGPLTGANMNSGLDAVSEPAPRPIPADAKLSPSPLHSPGGDSEAFTEEKGQAASNDHDGAHPDTASSGITSKLDAQVEKDVNTAESSPVNIKEEEPAAPVDAEEEKRAKLALWNELKISAFSRTVTTLYGIVLLSMQTHVQLNLLGRYAYLTSVSTLSNAEASSSDPSNDKHQIRLERHDTFGDFDDLASLDERRGDYDDDDDKARIRSQEPSGNSDVLKDGIDVQTERLYLTLSWWFLHRGWRSLADLVQDAVHDVFDDVALKTPLTHAHLCSMLRKVRRRIEYEGVRDDNGQYGHSSFASFDAKSELSEATTAATNRRRGRRRNFSAVLFPPSGEELQTLYEANALGPAWSQRKVESASLDAFSSTLSGLLDETRDIVESDDFWRIMKLGLRSVFVVLENSLRPSFGLGPAAVMNGHEDGQADALTTASIVELPADGSLDSGLGKSVRLASLFPAVARQSTAAIHGVPNEYVDALSNVKELRAFCAVIYSAWS